MKPRIPPRLLTAVKLTVTLALLAAALRMIRPGELAGHFRAAAPAPLAAAALIIILGGFAGAASWFCVLRLRLPGLRFRDAAACHWIGMFFNSFLPSNVGGDIVKGTLLASSAAPPAFIVASLLIDRAVNLAMLLGVGGAAWLLPRHGPLPAAAALALFLTLSAAALAALPRLLGTPPGRRFAIPFLLAALASQALKTGSNVIITSALGLGLPATGVWTVIPVFGVVSALPISIGGLGPREWVAQYIATPLNMDGTALVTLSLAGHLLTVLVNLLGAIPLLLRKAPPKNTPNAA